jgi:hypothetical protein
MSLWNKGHCTLFWDTLFGVDISMSCWGHDRGYDHCNYWAKLESDFALGLDIWAVAVVADKRWKRAAIRAISVAMFTGVSTFGNFFWIAGCVKQRGL